MGNFVCKMMTPFVACAESPLALASNWVWQETFSSISMLLCHNGIFGHYVLDSMNNYIFWTLPKIYSIVCLCIKVIIFTIL